LSALTVSTSSGGDVDRALVADGAADERLLDGGEHVTGAERDDAGLEVVLVGVDLGLLGRLLVRGVDDAVVVGRSDRVRDADEVAVLESVGVSLGLGLLGLLGRVRLLLIAHT